MAQKVFGIFYFLLEKIGKIFKIETKFYEKKKDKKDRSFSSDWGFGCLFEFFCFFF